MGLIEWSDSGNPRKKNYLDQSEGKRMQDVWLDYKDPQYPVYPTEKNQGFVDVIVRTSSNEDSVVLDCYCGSGTTLKAAAEAGRQWIGIDRSEVAIQAACKKLKEPNTLFGSDYEYVVMEELKYEYA